MSVRHVYRRDRQPERAISGLEHILERGRYIRPEHSLIHVAFRGQGSLGAPWGRGRKTVVIGGGNTVFKPVTITGVLRRPEVSRNNPKMISRRPCERE